MKLLSLFVVSLFLLLACGCQTTVGKSNANSESETEVYVPPKERSYKAVPTPQIGDEITFEFGSFKIEAPIPSKAERLAVSLMDDVEEFEHIRRKNRYYLENGGDVFSVYKNIVRIKVIYGDRKTTIVDNRKPLKLEGEELERLLEKQRVYEKIEKDEWNFVYKQRLTEMWKDLYELNARKLGIQYHVGSRLELSCSENYFPVEYECGDFRGWDDKLTYSWLELLANYEAGKLQFNSKTLPAYPIIEKHSMSTSWVLELLFDKWQIDGGYSGIQKKTDSEGNVTRYYIADFTGYRIVDLKPKKQFDDDKKVRTMLEFEDTPIGDVVPLLEGLLQIKVVGSDKLKGGVTINVDREMTAQELWELFAKVFTEKGIKYQLDNGTLFVEMK